MKILNKTFLYLLLILPPLLVEAKLPVLTPPIVTTKLNEIMKAHASYKNLNEELVQRSLERYIDSLDPNKTYFLESDIQQWLKPSPVLVKKVLDDFNHSSFTTFFGIHDAMVQAIKRRHELEKKIDAAVLPSHVSLKEFKDMKWAQTNEELMDRWAKIKALQIETSTKLNAEVKDKALQRISKRQTKYEEEILNRDPIFRERTVLSNVLKATASVLDTHTAYFTPDEATQFMINVQQRLFGIGAQLRDDLNGFTVVKIIDGGPAAIGKELKAKDRVIAVNGEPVVGMDIIEAVDLIRGEENTPVTLTVIRENKDGEAQKDEKLDVVVRRGQVVLKETRFSSSYEPFGDGVIGYVRLYSFYQDPDSASATDISNEINKLKNEHKLKALILDLRYNTGGLLTQAVDVSGLFMNKGTVVSVKDHTGSIQHLRNLGGKEVWNGPLIILVNRASASASEIVAQTLQDYGRAIIIGDPNTYGKGSFQTFTLNTTANASVDPEGEYKVTRGRYYTVSGKTPQLTGVSSDIVVPGVLSELEVGERFAKYPLANDQIKDNYDDDLADVPFTQRSKIKMLYKFDLQPKLLVYNPYLMKLKDNSSYRIEHNLSYQSLLKELKKDKDDTSVELAEAEAEEPGTQNDLQLTEAYNIMKDLLVLLHTDGKN